MVQLGDVTGERLTSRRSRKTERRHPHKKTPQRASKSKTELKLNTRGGSKEGREGITAACARKVSV
ncbi:hypothetical protein K443DRAFT_675925, partial [Laccaria amethystina LaAM-08-1]